MAETAYGSSNDLAYPPVELPSLGPEEQPNQPLQITISKPSPPITLQPVEHQPEFETPLRLVPVDHHPEFIDDTGRNAQEPPETLALQQRHLQDGSRYVQMFPAGTSELALPSGLQRTQNDRGAFHYDPTKITEQEILDLSGQGRENEFLGLGPVSKPEVEHRVAHGEQPVAITEYTPEGVEVRSAAGTDKTAHAQKQFFEQTKQPGNIIAVGPPPSRVPEQSGLPPSFGFQPTPEQNAMAKRFLEAVNYMFLGAPANDASGRPLPPSYGLPGQLYETGKIPEPQRATPQMPETGTWSDEQEAQRQVDELAGREASVGFGTNLGLQTMGASMPFKKPSPTTVGMFGGPLAKGVREGGPLKESMERAMHMDEILGDPDHMIEQAQETGRTIPSLISDLRQRIWDETGWFKGVDGKWRHEIPDIGAKLKDVNGQPYPIDRPHVTTVGEVLDHPELFKQYPGLQHTQVTFEKDVGQPYDAARNGFGHIGIVAKEVDQNNPEKMKAALAHVRKSVLHELQHNLQGHEGFSAGANPTDKRMRPAALKAVRSRIPAAKARMSEIEQDIKDWAIANPDMDPMDFFDRFPKTTIEYSRLIDTTKVNKRAVNREMLDRYERTSGEVESKNVEDRADLDEQMRKMAHPDYTASHPAERQIVSPPTHKMMLRDDDVWYKAGEQPKLPVKIRQKSGGQFDAYLGNKLVGRMILEMGDNAGSVFKVHVDEPYRRQGVALQLYEAAEKAHGSPLRPSEALSDAGFAFWRDFRPEAVANDMRMNRDQLMGQPVDSSYGPGRITSVGSRGAIATIDGKDSTFFVPKKELDRILASDMQYQMRSEAPTAPPFYSAVARAIDDIPQEKAPPAQWAGMLRNKPGVKPEELKWLGLDDWLREQKGPVTKQQIYDFVKANQIEVKEVTKGADVTENPEYRRLDAENEQLTKDFDETLEDGDRDRRAEITDRMNDNHDRMRQLLNEHDATKFHSYQLPGGENYRELLLTLPDRPPHGDMPNGYQIVDENAAARAAGYDVPDDGRQRWRYKSDLVSSRVFDSREEAVAAAMREAYGRDANNFKSSHWDEPNVLAHIRFNDRTIDGKKTLFVEEVQSDWHQKGKREGYYGQREPFTNAEREELQKAKVEAANIERAGLDNILDNDIESNVARYRELRNRIQELETRRMSAAQGGVPDAPFKTTWPELAMKRMIKYAADNGYDRVAWTPGDVQAARYDLSKHVDEVHYFPQSDYLTFKHKNGGWDETENVPKSKLADYIGKDAAEKLLNTEREVYKGLGRLNGDEYHALRGLDLKVGGEGMKGFYDQILPATVNKLVKKYGAKVEKSNIGTDRPGYDVVSQDGNITSSYATFGSATDAINNIARVAAEHRVNQSLLKVRKNEMQQRPVHAVDITPQMQTAVREQGIPMFKAKKPEPELPQGEAFSKSAALGHPFPQLAERYPDVGKPIWKTDKKKEFSGKGETPEEGYLERYRQTEMSKRFPDVDLPDGMKRGKRKGIQYLGKGSSPEGAELEKFRSLVQEDIDAGRYDPYFDVEKRFDVNPKNYPKAERTTDVAVPAKQETIARYEKIANAPEAIQRLKRAYNVGRLHPLAKGWYMMGQLEKEFIKELGPKEGPKAFAQRFGRSMAATTGGATPQANLILSQFGNYLREKGLSYPKESYELPYPVGGGKYGVMPNIAQHERLMGAGNIEAAENPKRHNFESNFEGHADRSTIDEQMSRIFDPKMSVPPGDSYGVFEAALNKTAKELGVTPRELQEVAWAGHKAMTDPGYSPHPMIQTINEAIERTHRITGMPKAEIVRRGLVRSEIPIYGLAAGIVAPAAIEAAKEQSP